MDNLQPLEPLHNVIKDLIFWLDGTEYPYVLIGGVAASLLGRPRATRDTDVLVLVDERLWKEFLETATQQGFEARIEDPLKFAHRNRVLLLRHKASFVDIDISFGLLPFEEEAVHHRRTLSIAGLQLPLPRVEDLIIMKVLARRPRDIVDIEGLLDAHPRMDLDRVFRLAAEFSEALEMPEILETLEVLIKARRKTMRRGPKKTPEKQPRRRDSFPGG